MFVTLELYENLISCLDTNCGKTYAKLKPVDSAMKDWLNNVVSFKNGSFSFLSLKKIAKQFAQKSKSENLDRLVRNATLEKLYFSKLSNKLNYLLQHGECDDFIGTGK